MWTQETTTTQGVKAKDVVLAGAAGDEALLVTENMSPDEKSFYGHASAEARSKPGDRLVHSTCLQHMSKIQQNKASWPAVDLHGSAQMCGTYIIDHFTRFSAGSIVKTKKSSEILKSFINY